MGCKRSSGAILRRRGSALDRVPNQFEVEMSSALAKGLKPWNSS
jgi:hypothetical protein